MRCIVKDKLFIPIENIDYDCFISTGKYISAKCDKNPELLLLNGENGPITPNQSFHSTLVLQTQMQRNVSNSSYSYHPTKDEHDDDHIDNSDREDLPFIVNHDSNLSNISSHASNTNITFHSIQQNDYWKHQAHNNMPVS